MTETDREVSGQSTYAVERDQRQQRFIEIRRRDAVQQEPIAAIAYAGPTGYRTYAPPHRFVGTDARTYLVKPRAQEGLGAELIAGRIGAFLGIAAETIVMEIGAASLPRNGSLDHFSGPQLAMRELEPVFNNEELVAYGMSPLRDQVDWDSWSLVLCFQSWLYVRDAQAVLRWTDGKVFSVDHGNCFFELAKGPTTGVVAPSLHSVSGTRFDASRLHAAVREIELIPEQILLELVSNVPDGDNWRMPIERRLRIAEWLLRRQPSVRDVLPRRSAIS